MSLETIPERWFVRTEMQSGGCISVAVARRSPKTLDFLRDLEVKVHPYSRLYVFLARLHERLAEPFSFPNRFNRAVVKAKKRAFHLNECEMQATRAIYHAEHPKND